MYYSEGPSVGRVHVEARQNIKNEKTLSGAPATELSWVTHGLFLRPRAFEQSGSCRFAVDAQHEVDSRARTTPVKLRDYSFSRCFNALTRRPNDVSVRKFAISELATCVFSTTDVLIIGADDYEGDSSWDCEKLCLLFILCQLIF